MNANPSPLSEESLSHLAKVFSSDEEIVISAEGPPLMRACEIIGQLMGLKFKTPSSRIHSVEEICADSGIRYRQIALTKHWWQHSQEHFLGFEKNTRHPVALIYMDSEYEMINPMTQERTKVDGTSSKKIELLAYTFYKTLPDNPTFSKILHFCIEGTKREYSALFLVGFLSTFIAFFFPFANKVLFDMVIPNFNMNLYFQVMIGLIIATISSGFFFFMRSLLLLRLDGIFENRLQIAFWDRLLKLPVPFFRSMAVGDLIQRSLVIDTIRSKLSDNTLRVFLNSIFGLSYLLVMFLYSWQLSIVGLFFSFAGAGFTAILFFFLLQYQRKILASNATINAFLIQIINAIAKIRIAVAENRVFSRWARDFSQNQRLSFQAQTLQVIAKTFATVLGSISYFFIFLVVFMIMSSESANPASEYIPPFTVGTFLAFNAAFMPFSEAIMDLTSTLISSVELVPFWERARPIFTTPIETCSEKGDPGRLKGDIQLENVSFRYDKNAVLLFNKISLTVQSGEFAAIVGPSGSGKSTICRLLIGFEVPEEGRVLYDHKDLAGINPYKVRQQIGTVFQNSGIFKGTIKDNITCGVDYSREEIFQAMELSLFSEDFKTFPMGLETILLTGGGVISGGQRQKILLARALVRRPKILLLDEATSFLDNHTQDAVTRNLSNLNVTRIVIAHRLSTIKKADRIYLMDQGQLKVIPYSQLV